MRIFIAMLAFAALFANASDMKDAAYKLARKTRRFQKIALGKNLPKEIEARRPIERNKKIAGAGRSLEGVHSGEGVAFICGGILRFPRGRTRGGYEGF